MPALRLHLPATCPSLLLAAALVVWAAPAHAARRFEGAFFGQSGNSSWSVVPISFAIADIDADGHPDVITPGPNESLQLLLGTGDGTLAPPIPIVEGGGRARHVVVADFDLDGHLDVGATTYGWGSEAAVYFGTGSPSAWVRVPIPITNSLQLCTEDVDGDARPDLVCAMTDGVLRSFLSRPGRTFEVVSQTHLNFSGHFQSMIPRDLDGDGWVDLILSARVSGYHVWIGRGRGDGTFQISGMMEPGDPGAVALADVTGGPAPDLVVPHRWAVAIQEGHPNGTFGTPQNLPTFGTERALAAAVGDVTGDGVPDLVTSEGLRDAILVRPGLGGGAFGAVREFFVGCNLQPFRLADMNGDGALDIVAAATDHEEDYAVPPGILIALGDGAGTFGTRPIRAAIPPASTIQTIPGDFDEDGRPDIAALAWTNPNPALYVFRVDPARTLVAGQTLPLPGLSSDGFAADLDGDGHLDLVFDKAWLPGAGDGTFASPITLPTGSVQLLGVADLTEDGTQDLLAASGSSFLVYPGGGAGAFGSPISRLLFQSYAGPVRVGDLNGDSHPDVLARDGTRMVIAYGPFVGPAARPNLRWDSWNQPPFTLGDVDGDGRDDVVESWIVQAARFAGAELHVRLQQSDGTLGSPIVSLWPSAATGAMKLVDINGDGAKDLVHHGIGAVYLGLGAGDGHFSIEGSASSGDWSPSPFVDAAVLDFDGDGRLDLTGVDAVGDTLGLQIHFGRDPAPPSVANIAVTPGGPMEIGEPVTVYWSADDDAGLGEADVSLSRSGLAGPFVKLGTAAAGSFTFPWIVAGPPSDSLCFKVLVRDVAGNTAWSRSPLVAVVPPSTAVPTGSDLPARLALSVRGANPVRDRVRLAVAMPRPGRARLTLVDLQGRRAATIFDGPLISGTIELERALPALSPGLFFLRIEGVGETSAARLVVVR